MRKHQLAAILLAMILATAGFVIYNSYRDSRTASVNLAVEHLVRPKHLNSIYGDGEYRLQEPMDVAVARDGRVYVADTGNGRIAVFDELGNFLTAFGHTDEGRLFYPTRLHIAENGNIYVVDPSLKTVRIFSADGNYLQDLQGSKFWGIPGAIITGPQGLVYLADIQKHQILSFNNDSFIGEYGKEPLPPDFPEMPLEDGRLKFPNAVTLDANGNLWVADSNNARLQVFSPAGEVILSLNSFGKEEKFSLPRSVAFDSAGRLYVADMLANKIYVYTDRYEPLFAFGGMGLAEGKLFLPSGMAIDRKNRVYIAEKGAHRISIFASPATGRILPLDNQLKPVIPLTLLTLVAMFSYSFIYRKKKQRFQMSA